GQLRDPRLDLGRTLPLLPDLPPGRRLDHRAEQPAAVRDPLLRLPAEVHVLVPVPPVPRDWRDRRCPLRPPVRARPAAAAHLRRRLRRRVRRPCADALAGAARGAADRAGRAAAPPCCALPRIASDQRDHRRAVAAARRHPAGPGRGARRPDVCAARPRARALRPVVGAPPGRSRRGGGIRRGLPGAARTGGAGIPLCRRPLMTPRLTALLAAALVVGTFGATPTTTKPSLAERRGFSAPDIVLIVNGDDVGVSHAANMATIASLERGLMTSATIMVPC